MRKSFNKNSTKPLGQALQALALYERFFGYSQWNVDLH